MVAQGTASKDPVYIVIEGSVDNGSVDSVWAHSDDAYTRRNAIRNEGLMAKVISRKVR
jgi:hypothetical protein